MDAKALTVKILNDFTDKKINFNTAVDIIVLIMEIIEPMIFSGPEKLDYVLVIIEIILKEGKGKIPKEMLNSLKYLYDNKLIPNIISVLCKAFKQEINLIKKECMLCFNIKRKINK